MTETMIHVISDTGKILYQKKLDIDPMALHVYNIDDTNYNQNKFFNAMMLLGTSLDHILVYRGIELAWALKYNNT